MARMYIRHIRAGGFCARGARDWAARHNIDYNDFLKNGIDCEVLEATGDHFAITVCKLAREEEQQQRNEVKNG